MVKVFFNNSCNICRAEINHYKKHSNNSVEWIDVTSNEDAQKITSKSYKELLRRMHVIQDGKVIHGAESFLIIRVIFVEQKSIITKNIVITV